MSEAEFAQHGWRRAGLWRWLLLAAVALAGLLLLALAAGSLRYGSPEGLWLRVQAEIASRRQVDHPALVPTPLPTPTGLAALAIPTEAPTATLSPTAAAPTQTPTETAKRQAATTSPTAAATVVSPSATPTDTPSPAPVFSAAEPAVALSGLNHFWQTWNNCGPATLAMNLSYFGSNLGQADVAKVLKPDSNDKNVNPAEMAAFASAQGLNALVQVNGDDERLRLLLSNGIPVLIETWLEPEPNDGMGHYRLLTGYDDARGEWIAYDSYVSEGIDPAKPYPGIRLGFEDLDELWRVFNRTHVIVFSDEQAPLVEAIVGADLDEMAMWQRSLARAEADVAARDEDAFAWFNLGSSLTALQRYDEAAAAYDRARVIGLPWRMLWYQFGPFVAYYETGRLPELIALADATIATAGNIEETFYWKGMGLKAMGDLEGARQAFQRAVELNANYAAGRNALTALDAP